MEERKQKNENETKERKKIMRVLSKKREENEGTRALHSLCIPQISI